MADDPIVGRYQETGEYRRRIRIDGPDDAKWCNGAKPCYSVTFLREMSDEVEGHKYMRLTEEIIKTRGWQKITEDDPATW